MSSSVDRSRPRTLAKMPTASLALGAAFVLAFWFWEEPWLFPLRMLVVVAHEASHALAAIATGGEVVEVGLDWREGGHALTRGGWPFLVLNAGYLGSLVWGVLLLGFTRQAWAARALCIGLGVGLLLMAAAWVRPVFGFGFAYTVAAGIVLAGFGAAATPGVCRGLLRGLGVFSVLYAFLDIRDDVFLRTGASDAAFLATATGTPAVVWGVLWCGAGLAVLAVTWRRLR